MPIEVESPEQMGYDTIKNNLSESSYTDACMQDIVTALDLKNLVLCYGSHMGHDDLRILLAKDAGQAQDGHQAQDTGLSKDDILLTTGAAGALFIIATTLLEKDDELVVIRPNYATNIETPRAIGAKIK